MSEETGTPPMAYALELCRGGFDEVVGALKGDRKLVYNRPFNPYFDIVPVRFAAESAGPQRN